MISKKKFTQTCKKWKCKAKYSLLCYNGRILLFCFQKPRTFPEFSQFSLYCQVRYSSLSSLSLKFTFFSWDYSKIGSFTQSYIKTVQEGLPYSKEFGRKSLVVQWLGLSASTAVVWVQSLVRELRSCKPCNVVKNKQNFWFSIGFESCWTFSLLSGPSSKWNILWFLLQHGFLEIFHFPLISKNYIPWSLNIFL